ncbi:iron-containing alcohol dehydrogenase [Thermovenabulum sp.]|uniref:iron-containing alcohol dehydrogenase n=1 Tax=Thermovenabulum sp. TaxID=3100335 RepID=UPI003C7BD61B
MKMDFQYFFPSRLIFGTGKVKEVGIYAKEYGKKALIVTGKSSAKNSGALDKITESLRREGISWEIYDRVVSNPTFEDIEEAAAFALDFSAQVIIGLGGGSAMDTAKGIALRIKNEEELEEYFEGKKSTKEAAPLILIPTTSGTGSEGNNIAVMTNTKNGVKKGLRSPHIYSKVSIIDPELTVTLPKRITAFTGMDAFFHALESFIGLRCQPFTEMYSLKAIELIVKNIEDAYKNGDDIEKRANMALASTLAGISIGISGVCALHAMEHPLSSFFGANHGEGLCPIAVPFLKYIKPHVTKKLASLAPIFNIDDFLSEEEKAKRVIEWIVEIIDKLNLPKSIGYFGVKKEDIETLARHVEEHMTHNLSTTPGHLKYEDIYSIYLASL